MTYINFHLFIEAIVHDQAVGHSYPMGLHGMPSDIGIVADVRIIEIGHCLLVGGGPGRVDGRKARHCRLLLENGDIFRLKGKLPSCVVGSFEGIIQKQVQRRSSG